MKIPVIYNFRNLIARKLTTSLTVLGIGLVVFVFSAVLMLAKGLEETLVATGDEDNVIFLRKGSAAEMSSGIPRSQTHLLETIPEAVRLEAVEHAVRLSLEGGAHE